MVAGLTLVTMISLFHQQSVNGKLQEAMLILDLTESTTRRNMENATSETELLILIHSLH